ncbi:MAG: DUF2958 domain-containing protein [Chitinispirillaceae bacterium]|nr:DUF2958 domain-containing protein [Chitinispirillaceae bacterium]
MSKLIPDSILKQLPKYGETAHLKFTEVKVKLKLFLPGTRWTWYVAEYDPEEQILWGFCRSGLGCDCDECGTAWLPELETARTPFGPVERDLYWNPETTLQDVLDGKVS